MKFYNNKKETPEKQKVALIDIDETICHYPKERRYDLAEPINLNIDKINNLFEKGWKIIYWTARGGVSKQDYYEFTLNQLKEWGCKFHELTTGTSPNPKPSFDLIVDDKAKRIEEL